MTFVIFFMLSLTSLLTLILIFKTGYLLHMLFKDFIKVEGKSQIIHIDNGLNLLKKFHFFLSRTKNKNNKGWGWTSKKLRCC